MKQHHYPQLPNARLRKEVRDGISLHLTRRIQGLPVIWNLQAAFQNPAGWGIVQDGMLWPGRKAAPVVFQSCLSLLRRQTGRVLGLHLLFRP